MSYISSKRLFQNVHIFLLLTWDNWCSTACRFQSIHSGGTQTGNISSVYFLVSQPRRQFYSPYLQSTSQWPQGHSHTCPMTATVHWNTQRNKWDPLKDKGFNVRALQCFISHVPHKAAVLKVWQMCENTGVFVHKMSNSNTVSNLRNMEYAAFSFEASRISDTLSQSQPDLAV